MSRARGFCFTINNYTDEDISRCLECIDSCVYSVIGFEEGSEKHTPHIQGYGYWKNARTIKAISKEMPRAHIEIAKGNAEQNRTYCIKSGEFNEFGTMPKQGRRNDLEQFKEAIFDGDSKKKLIDEHTGCMAKYDRFYKTCRSIVLEEEAKKMIPPEIIAIIGDAGSGKTRMIYDNHHIDDIYKITMGDGSDNSLWWDGYDGQDVILIDDFNNDIKLGYMLQLLDRYPMRLAVKGGFTYRCATKIYITTNLELHQWYPNCQSRHRDAIKRRIHNIINLKNQQYLFDQKTEHNMSASQISCTSENLLDETDTNKESNKSSSQAQKLQELKTYHHYEPQTYSHHTPMQQKHSPTLSETSFQTNQSTASDQDAQLMSPNYYQKLHQFLSSSTNNNHNHNYPLTTHNTSLQIHDIDYK